MRDSVRPSKLRVQGIRSDFTQLTLRGERMDARFTEAVLRGTRLIRTIEGASSITLPLSDIDGELRRHPIFNRKVDIVLDGLGFRLVGRSRSGTSMTLTFEDREVARQRIAPGAKKVLRDKQTRAEFYLSQLREVPGPPLRFFSPELHTVQPIKSVRQDKEAELEVDEQRGKGIDPGADLTVKGVKATSEQIAVGATSLRTAESLKAPVAAMIALIAAEIVESVMKNLPGGDRDSVGVLQVRTSLHGDIGSDVVKSVTAFLEDGFTGQGGAIELAKRGIDPATIAQMVQGSDPAVYGSYIDEAREWVDEYLGGNLAGSYSTTRTTEVPYAFERGKNETIWENGGALAEEVRWRRFVSNGITYFIAEPDLLASKIRMRIDDDTPGVDDISWEVFSRKEADEATITCRVNSWAAPPGSVVFLRGQGDAVDGRYIVSSIETDLDLRDPDDIKTATITVKRPQEPLPEPAAETRSKTITTDVPSRGGGGAAGSSIGAQLAAWAEKQVGVTEGSAAQERYANELGYSPSLVWCSIFVGYGLKFACGVSNLPSNPAYSGAWLDWSGGRRVSSKDLEPGDLVIFDWGDGGITDHVAIYDGNGQVIGGNQSNAVTRVPISTNSIVGCVRVEG